MAKAGEQRPHGGRCTQDPKRQLGRDAERPLRADEGAEQVGPLVPDRQLDQLAVGQHDLRRQDVVDREAVLQAVRAARVLRDVAADRADLLRGRVGRVVEAVLGDRARDVEIRDARLDDDLAAVEVDGGDPSHPRQRDHDAVGDRQRAAREAGPRAARHERGSRGRLQIAHDGLHLRAALCGSATSAGTTRRPVRPSHS